MHDLCNRPRRDVERERAEALFAAVLVDDHRGVRAHVLREIHPHPSTTTSTCHPRLRSSLTQPRQSRCGRSSQWPLGALATNRCTERSSFDPRSGSEDAGTEAALHAEHLTCGASRCASRGTGDKGTAACRRAWSGRRPWHPPRPSTSSLFPPSPNTPSSTTAPRAPYLVTAPAAPEILQRDRQLEFLVV